MALLKRGFLDQWLILDSLSEKFLVKTDYQNQVKKLSQNFTVLRIKLLLLLFVSIVRNNIFVNSFVI